MVKKAINQPKKGKARRGSHTGRNTQTLRLACPGNRSKPRLSHQEKSARAEVFKEKIKRKLQQYNIVNAFRRNVTETKRTHTKTKLTEGFNEKN